MPLTSQDYVELESLALEMRKLGNSVLGAVQSSRGPWDGTVYIQLQQRDACYVELGKLWFGSNMFWAHQSGQDDPVVEQASWQCYEVLEGVLKQNDELQSIIHQKFAGTNERLTQIDQQKRIELAYHPMAKAAGGFVAEIR